MVQRYTSSLFREVPAVKLGEFKMEPLDALVPYEAGQWVRYSDYAALESLLHSEREKMRALVERWREGPITESDCRHCCADELDQALSDLGEAKP